MLTISRRPRRAFTLAEMLFVLTLFGMVAGATMQIIVRQQRFYAGATDMMSMRSTLRDVATIVPTDLRGLSSIGGDIYAMSDSAVDFRLATGIGVVCTIGVGRTTLVIPPTSLASRSAVSTWLTAPAKGDTAFVYDEGPTSSVADDSWQKVALTDTLLTGVCPTTTGYTTTAAEAAAAKTVLISAALNAGVVPGSVIRFYRRAKYKLYQPVAGGAWYVGYLDCPGGVCGSMQAVAGPYLPYSTTASATGLRFVYRDSTGAVTATPTAVARIDLTARAQTQNTVRMPGRVPGYYQDSLVVSVALRNRS
jgi:prepilin-type N-terminal cleavage/methylation domain-containing protein